MTYDDWSPDPDVDCDPPDLRYTLYALLGALVVVAALAIAVVGKLRHAS